MNNAEDAPLPELSVPAESLLSCAVVLGKQYTGKDRYGLAAELTDLAVRGYITLCPDNNDRGVTLRLGTTAADGLDKTAEAEFLEMLAKYAEADGYIPLSNLVNRRDFLREAKTLGRRVTLAHRSDYNKQQPLYSVDPTRAVYWQYGLRITSWLLGAASVYAQPGWQGLAAGIAIVSAAEVPPILTFTPHGRMLRRQIADLREQMLELTKQSAPAGGTDLAGLCERASAFAFLKDDDLCHAWPSFLSKTYNDYPTWLEHLSAKSNLAHKQKHIETTLSRLSLVVRPGH